MTPVIPIVLFAYARPNHLRRTLACLRENHVPLIVAFADGAKTSDVAELERVNEVRHILDEIDWCEVHLVERTENLGLGKSIRMGVADVFQLHDTIIVFEDDLICAPGTYQYLCAALEHFKDASNVMSVTGWTHPRVIPDGIKDQPYFDGRSASLVWGTWRRVWKGMEQDSLSMIQDCKNKNIDIYRYGADLVEMAKIEKERNIWAVRFLFLHILNKGLCLRPPYSLVEHIGYDTYSTNVADLEGYSTWDIKLTKESPWIPEEWPESIEHPECSALWQKACGGKPSLFKRANSFMFQIALRLKTALKRTRVP